MTAQSGLGFSGIVAINIPVGGAPGEVLTKLTAANYDYDWAPGGGGGGAPTNAEYVVLSLDATLTDERVLTAGTGITLVDGGAGGTVTLSFDAATAGYTLQDAYDANTVAPHITPLVTVGLEIAGELQIDGSLAQGNNVSIEMSDTYTQAAAFIGGGILSNGTINYANATWIWSLLSENKLYIADVGPGFAAFTLFNALAQIRNGLNASLVQALVLNAGVSHQSTGAVAVTAIQNLGLSFSPNTRAFSAFGSMTKTTGDTAVRCSPTHGTVNLSSIAHGTIRGLHMINPAPGLFQPSAGTESMTAYVGLEMDAIPFGGNVTKRALRSALTAASNSLMIENTGGAQSDFGAGSIHLDDNANVNFGNTFLSPDISTAWNAVQSAWQFAFALNASQLWWSNPAAGRFLFDNNNGNTSGEYNWNCLKFSLGAQTGAVGNQKGVFVAGAETVTVAGEFSQFLLTQAANDTIDAALSLYAGWTINAPSPTIGTGSLTTGVALNIGGNPSTASVNRVGLRILSNPSGGSGVNAALWVTAGRSRFDGIVDINNGVALGGGAAATLGTIGGSGPTAAAQAQWLQVEINGVNHWIPVWT